MAPVHRGAPVGPQDAREKHHVNGPIRGRGRGRNHASGAGGGAGRGGRQNKKLSGGGSGSVLAMLGSGLSRLAIGVSGTLSPTHHGTAASSPTSTPSITDSDEERGDEGEQDGGRE